MNVLKGLAVSCMLAVLAGCNTTSGVGHLNPKYRNYHLSNVAIDVQPRTEISDQLEVSLVEALNERGIKAFGTSDIDRFVKNTEEARAMVVERGAVEVLYIGLSDGANSSVAGAQTFGSVNGNTFNATSVPIVASQRRMEARVVLSRRSPEDVIENVVDGAASRVAGGVLSTRDESMVSELTSGIMETLESAGVLRK